jgi:hypothetical protein
MRLSTSTTAAACVIAAGLAAAGCAGASSPASDSTTTSPAASAPAQAQAPASADSNSTAAQAAGSGGRCQPQNLSFALGTAASGVLPVDMTNRGSAACVMTGFAGVDLVGLARGQANYTWSLARQVTGYSPVTLQPGGIAHFSLHYLTHDGGGGADADDSIQVDHMVITPPDDFTQAQLSWNVDLELQDGATHPVTWIGPVVAGA